MFFTYIVQLSYKLFQSLTHWFVFVLYIYIFDLLLDRNTMFVVYI